MLAFLFALLMPYVNDELALEAAFARCVYVVAGVRVPVVGSDVAVCRFHGLGPAKSGTRGK